MSHVEPVSQRLWSDWFFERVPLPPGLFGALILFVTFVYVLRTVGNDREMISIAR